MTDLFYAVYILFFLSIIFVIIFWSTNLHLNRKFVVFLNVLTALTIFFTTFAIIIQLYSYVSSQINTQISNYDSMFNELIVDTITYFEENPKINYYYSEMFKPLHYNKTNTNYKRNFPQEQQITYTILQRLSSFIYYLDNDKTLSPFDKEDITTKIHIFINGLLRSPIFIENYNNLAPKLLTPTFKNYFNKNFNI